MNYRRTTQCAFALVTALLTLGMGATSASADAPQLTVEEAHYAINTHTPNWTCDPQSDLPSGTSCYSTYAPASYTFAHHGHVVENPFSGQYIWLMDGGARDGGFANKVGDNLLTFESFHPQAPGKVFRTDNIEPAAIAGLHWEPFSAFWQPTTAFSGSGSKYYWFANVTDSGQLSMVTDNRLKVGESASGTSNYTWRDVYHIERPSGKESGAMHFLNRDDFIPHPNDPTRWIGLVTWTRQTPTSNDDSGVMPVYIDTDDEVVGFQFATEGWCEYPLGHKFDTYNPAITCSLTGNTSSTVPGAFYKISGLGKNVVSLAEIDGKILVLYTGSAEQTCGVDKSGQGGVDERDFICIDNHAPCPPGQDKQLYVTRRSDPKWDYGRTFRLREMALSTWDETTTGHAWIGTAKQVQMSALVDDQFDLSPTDIGGLFGFYDVDLKQFSNGTIYMYMGLKHSLCLPESNPIMNSWDRSPKTKSGTSFVWFRLTDN